ncbi:hypothetical protein T484DRAFT_1859812 [Baffinella frigidus]|nr:hypothetical protein T484DRAFT_1859812 [Cryptophyta sp. CCMP2293]
MVLKERLALLAALLSLVSVVTSIKAFPSSRSTAAFCPTAQTPPQGPALRATKSSSTTPEGVKTSDKQRAHQLRRTLREWSEKFRKGKLMRSVDSMEGVAAEALQTKRDAGTAALDDCYFRQQGPGDDFVDHPDMETEMADLYACYSPDAALSALPEAEEIASFNSFLRKKT